MNLFLWKNKFYFSHFSKNLNQHRFFSLCATTSFYFLFTLIPFIILIFLLLSKWVSNSDILLLDESTSNLDIRTKKFIFDILNKKNITIINSTHNHDDFDYHYHIKIDVSEESREIKIVE